MTTEIKIVPDQQDLEAIERERGEPRTPIDEIKHYRLAQARKLVRFYEHGRLPLQLMRALDEIVAQANVKHLSRLGCDARSLPCETICCCQGAGGACLWRQAR